MHKSWPTGVRGVILPYPAKNTKKIKALTLKKAKGKERFLQSVLLRRRSRGNEKDDMRT